MYVRKIKHNVSYIPSPNEVHLTFTELLPPVELVTSALGLLFDGDKFLMTELVSRGWDIPGGHREPGETPSETVVREVREETGAEAGHLRLLGYEQTIILAPKPDGFRYPYPVSYQVFYCGRVAILRPFAPTAETYGRGLFTPDEAIGLKWVKGNRELYEAAYEAVVGPLPR